MRYAQIRQYDVANGEGVRVSVFVTGCTHNCFNCFNKQYQDFGFGELWTEKETDMVVELVGNRHISGLSLLGGEPFQNAEGLYYLTKKIKETYPTKSIWVWTGFLYEQLTSLPYGEKLLGNVDVLVDGKFIQAKKDLTLKWKGSENQRIIDVQKSLKTGQVVLHMD